MMWGQRRKRVKAARVLWVQSRSVEEQAGSDGSHLADPSNQAEAQDAYDAARRALLWTDMGDVKADVYAAAVTLGLATGVATADKDLDDLLGPCTQPGDHPR